MAKNFIFSNSSSLKNFQNLCDDCIDSFDIITLARDNASYEFNKTQSLMFYNFYHCGEFLFSVIRKVRPIEINSELEFSTMEWSLSDVQCISDSYPRIYLNKYVNTQSTKGFLSHIIHLYNEWVDMSKLELMGANNA